MRHETEGVTESLLNNAKNEFLEYGFHNASLRRIASKSGVSTNSIYSRFHDKTGLFGAVVKEAADGLMEIYLKSVNEAKETVDVEQAMQIGGDGTDIVLKYIYRYKDEFKLIFCCSAGTEYESFFDKLAAIEENYYKQFAKQYSNGEHSVDDFFIHVYCRTGWQYVYEIVSHDKSYDEAYKYMQDVMKFNYAGWRAVLDIRDD